MNNTIFLTTGTSRGAGAALSDLTLGGDKAGKSQVCTHTAYFNLDNCGFGPFFLANLRINRVPDTAKPLLAISF